MLPLAFLLALLGCGGTTASPDGVQGEPGESPVGEAAPAGVPKEKDPAAGCGFAFEESHSQAAHGVFAVATDALDCEYDGIYTAGAGLEVRWKSATGLAKLKLAPGGCNGGDAASTVVVAEEGAGDCPKAFSAAKEILKAGKLPAPIALQ